MSFFRSILGYLCLLALPALPWRCFAQEAATTKHSSQEEQIEQLRQTVGDLTQRVLILERQLAAKEEAASPGESTDGPHAAAALADASASLGHEVPPATPSTLPLHATGEVNPSAHAL